MANNIPITTGSGAASVATETIAGISWQQVEIYGGGGSSVLSINTDGSLNARVSGSVLAINSPTSVSGTAGASVIGWVPIQASNTSVISYVQNSVAAVIIGGSIAATFTPPANQSVSGTVGASIIGLAPVSVSNFPTNQNVSGSVVAFQGTTPWTVVSSVAGGLFPISGSVAAVITNTPNVNAAGSVVAFQGGVPWATVNVGSIITIQQGSVITVWKDSSVLSVPVGSTIAVLQAPSIVGTYAEDAAHTSADKGVFTLNVRNDTLSSVTSTDGDYGALAVGPSGEGIVANAPLTKWVQGTADFRNGNAGASIVVIAAQGASIFTYITGVQIANMGSASVLVTLAGTGSTLGYSIAPAGGGSNIYFPNALKTPANATFAASISGIASVLVSAQGFISKS